MAQGGCRPRSPGSVDQVPKVRRSHSCSAPESSQLAFAGEVVNLSTQLAVFDNDVGRDRARILEQQHIVRSRSASLVTV